MRKKKQLILQIEIDGAQNIKDLEKYAEGLNLDIKDAVTKLILRGVQKELQRLNKNKQETFELMLHSEIHPDMHHMFDTIQDIIDYRYGN